MIYHIMEETTTTDPQDATLSGTNPQAEIANTTTQALDETSEITKVSPSIEEQQAQIKRLETALGKSNKDAKDHRLKNNDLEKTIAELKAFKEQIDAEKLSETEKQTAARQKLEKQLADLQSELANKANEVKEQKINNDIFTKAARVGINPSLAQKVLDAKDIEFDEKGNPTNIEDLLKSILKEYPNLAVQTRQSPSNAGGATNPTRSATANVQEITWDHIAKLQSDPAAFNALPVEYQKKIAQWMSDPKNQNQRSR